MERGEIAGDVIAALIGAVLGICAFVGLFAVALCTCSGCTG
jgi:hypothetical protein